MPDERMESIRQGIGVPPESPAAAKAEEERRARAAAAPPMDGAMGGTSDAESAGDEAHMNAAMGRGTEPDRPEDELSP